jgi:hypothetical protein
MEVEGEGDTVTFFFEGVSLCREMKSNVRELQMIAMERIEEKIKLGRG